VLATDAIEVSVEQVSFLRNGTGPNDAEMTKKFNDMMAGH